jgi:hypothetical protein
MTEKDPPPKPTGGDKKGDQPAPKTDKSPFVKPPMQMFQGSEQSNRPDLLLGQEPKRPRPRRGDDD